jgi:hypothetical protein
VDLYKVIIGSAYKKQSAKIRYQRKVKYLIEKKIYFGRRRFSIVLWKTAHKPTNIGNDDAIMLVIFILLQMENNQ